MKAKLEVLETFPVQVKKDVVEVLEGYLERAKNGELTGVAVAATLHNGASTGWSKSEDYHSLVGAVTTLSWRMIEQRQKDA